MNIAELYRLMFSGSTHIFKLGCFQLSYPQDLYHIEDAVMTVFLRRGWSEP